MTAQGFAPGDRVRHSRRFLTRLKKAGFCQERITQIASMTGVVVDVGITSDFDGLPVAFASVAFGSRLNEIWPPYLVKVGQ